MTTKKITIELDTKTYKELKDTCVALKNINIFGQHYKSATDEEISGLISLALKQKEFNKALQNLKEMAQNGVK